MNDADLDLWGKHLLTKFKKTRMPEMKNTFTLLKALVERIENNEDATIAVTGDKGKGKTSFAMNSSMVLSQLIQEKRKCHPAFTWGNISYRYDDIGDIVEKAGDRDHMVYIIDEAVDVAHAKEAMTRVNRELGKFMIKARKKNNLYFWNIPDFTELDSDIRNKVVLLWVHVFHKVVAKESSRGYALAAVSRRNLNPKIRDKWGLDENNKEVIHDVPALMEFFRKQQAFAGFIAFPPMPKAIEDAYLVPSYEALKKSSKEFNDELKAKRKKPGAETMKAPAPKPSPEPPLPPLPAE